MTTSEVHNLCREYNIKNYTINDDMSISVNGNVNLTPHRNIKYLPIKFKEVGGNFWCSYNQLVSLKYCPEKVSGDFSCSNNQLTSLKYCPETVGGFYCNGNQLTSLEYCPESVGGRFYCNYNQITNFDGLPEFFERPISIYENPVYEIYELFNEDHRCIYWIREFGVIQGGEVVRDRLEEVYHTLGMDIPNNITLKEYILV